MLDNLYERAENGDMAAYDTLINMSIVSNQQEVNNKKNAA
jgi:hypothetical protein